MVEKIKINVIDLDKTLVPYDSFRVLILLELKKTDKYMMKITLLRKIRFVSSEKYKKKVIEYLDNKYNEEYFEQFANKLYGDMDDKVLRLIDKHTQVGTVNILLSASPNFFVKYMVNRLKWCGTGSYIDGKGVFIHLYGENKVNWLMTNYCQNNYLYNFAISDSTSDNELLSQFENNIKWIT